MNARFWSTAAACSMVLALPACGEDDADGAGGATSSSGTPASSGNGGDGSGAAGASGSGASGGSGATGGEASGGSGGTDIAEIANGLEGYRIELPCTNKDALSYNPGDTCPWDPALDTNDDPDWMLKIEDPKVIGGDPDVVYDVLLRVRGVTEPKNYENGTLIGDHFYVGGNEIPNDYNIYSIHVADPEQTYYLSRNEAPVRHYMIQFDYEATIPMRGGTTATVGIYDHNDQAIANGEKFVIEGDPGPFAGHVIQINVLGVTEQP